ncbi:MAG: hypothetical protein SFT90_08000 [Rickettsiales bacterium]|nr:hypothetical protein [Rickettsiales bacterium]
MTEQNRQANFVEAFQALKSGYERVAGELDKTLTECGSAVAPNVNQPRR